MPFQRFWCGRVDSTRLNREWTVHCGPDLTIGSRKTRIEEFTWPSLSRGHHRCTPPIGAHPPGGQSIIIPSFSAAPGQPHPLWPRACDASKLHRFRRLYSRLDSLTVAKNLCEWVAMLAAHDASCVRASMHICGPSLSKSDEAERSCIPQVYKPIWLDTCAYLNPGISCPVTRLLVGTSISAPAIQGGSTWHPP